MAKHCQNCGSHVTKKFARNMFPNGEVTVCPSCPDKPLSELR